MTLFICAAGFFLVSNMSVGPEFADRQDLALLRAELVRLISIQDDEEFGFEVARMLSQRFGYQLPVKHGEWYPATSGAQFKIDAGGIIVLRDRHSEQTTLDGRGVALVAEDGKWHTEPSLDTRLSASLSVCDGHVILVDLEKGRVLRLPRAAEDQDTFR